MRAMETMRTRGVLALATAVVVAACGGGEQAGTEEQGEQAAAEQQGPVVPPDSQAAVTGMVMFEGTPPEAEPIDMSAEEACAAAYGGDGPTTQHVAVSDGHLANVFVYVKSDLGRDFPTPRGSVTLDQEDCRYHPHVFGIQTGQTLRITNSDSLLHNINAQPTENRGFNISQPQAGMATDRSFSLREVMIPVKCDVHGWMNAYIGVLPHPYYATTDEAGSFSLEALPPGTHVIEAWHERYGTQVDTVEVAAGGSAELSFTFSEDMAGAHVPLGEPLVLSHGGSAAH